MEFINVLFYLQVNILVGIDRFVPPQIRHNEQIEKRFVRELIRIMRINKRKSFSHRFEGFYGLEKYYAIYVPYLRHYFL